MKQWQASKEAYEIVATLLMSYEDSGMRAEHPAIQREVLRIRRTMQRKATRLWYAHEAPRQQPQESQP